MKDRPTMESQGPVRTLSAFATLLRLVIAASFACSPPETGTEEGADTTGISEQWTLSATGLGPLSVGIPFEEARRILGPDVSKPETTECSYVRSSRLPYGVSVMFVADTVRRIDIESDPVATEGGIKVGDHAERVRQHFGTAVRVLPHKYTAGHYLVVPATDTTFQLVFETEGDTITAMRGGQLPQVQWVEGCS